MNVQFLCNMIDQRKEELYDFLCQLIKINSESFGDHGNEEACARYIHKICQELGLESTLFSPLELADFENHPDYFPGRHLENRYNVTACWRGKEDRDELMLMGHIDTVEIGELSNWQFDPLAGEIKDGNILGRGACDDKYALATALFLIKILKEYGFAPKANLLFSAYCDEELGGSHGAMAAVMKNPCNRIVSMDGRQNQIWHCASGGQVVIYRYHTKQTVDSAELTAQAIPVVMEEIKKFADNRRRELEKNPFYAGTLIPATSLRYNEVRAGNNGTDLGVGELKFTFYTDKTKEEIYKEFAEIEAVLKKRLEPPGIEGDGFIPDTRFFHYGFCEPDCQDIQDMLEASLEAIGEEPIVCGSCLSDLSVILKYGSSKAYGFGAGRDFSEPGGAHQPNEYIECEALVKYAKAIGAYLLKVLG